MMKTFLAAAAFVGTASLAQAATISISTFSPSDYNAAIAGFDSAVVENFETGFTEGNVDADFLTSVGTFNTLGGTGSGGTVTGETFGGLANDGSKLAVRDGNVFGRTSTTKLLTGDMSDNMFLDSNDTFGIRWDISLGNRKFDQVLLTLTDAADTGAIMTVVAGDASQTFSAQGNANKKSVLIEFGEQVTSAVVLFEHTNSGGNLRINDGFSLDDIAVSAVPLPASVILMLAGLGGLGALRRARKSA